MTKNELKNEKWLPIANTNNYEVSDLGRIKKTYQNKKIKLLTPSSNGQEKNDYLFIKIDGKKKYIHQLVLESFGIQKPLGHECDHINSDKQDNRLSNLRYIERAVNRSHKGEKHGNSKLTERLVKLIKVLVNEGKTHKYIANIIEVSESTVGSIMRGKTWSHV